MLIPSSSPIIFSSSASEFAKHMQGLHDQSFHAGGGLSAHYQKLAIARKKMMDQGKTNLGLKRDNKGRVICPEATGGYKAGIPEVIMVDMGSGKPEMLTPEHSLWHHMESDGQGGYRLTAERAALHQKIIDDAVQNIPKSSDPTFTMLGGGPAAGKTTALKSGIVSGVPDKTQAVYINADDIKSELPEFERMRMSDDHADFFNGAGFAHEESSMLAKRVQAAAVSNGRNIVLDGTGDSSVEKLDAKISEASSAGYKVKGVYFTVPTAVAISRANERSLNSAERRYVPNKVVSDTHRDVSKTFKNAIDGNSFSSVVLIDSTTRGAAKIIGQTDASGKFAVADQAQWEAFLAKGNE